MDGRQRDRSAALIIAAVPVQALMIAGAAALVLGAHSASPARSVQFSTAVPAAASPSVPASATPVGPAIAVVGSCAGKTLLVVYPGLSQSSAGRPADGVTFIKGGKGCVVINPRSTAVPPASAAVTRCCAVAG